MKVVIHKNEDGLLLITSGAHGADLHAVAASAVGKGKKYGIIDASDIPLDDDGSILFRSALTVDDADLPYIVE